MTLGRPMTISKTDAFTVPLPLPADDGIDPMSLHDDYWLLETSPNTEFFIQSVKLYSITEEMLSTIYSRDKSNPFASRSELTPNSRLNNLDFNTILRIDNTLYNWKDSLPYYLQLQSTQSVTRKDAIRVRQANILHLRYINLDHMMIEFYTKHC